MPRSLDKLTRYEEDCLKEIAELSKEAEEDIGADSQLAARADEDIPFLLGLVKKLRKRLQKIQMPKTSKRPATS